MKISYYHTLNPSKGMGDPSFWGEFFLSEKKGHLFVLTRQLTSSA